MTENRRVKRLLVWGKEVMARRLFTWWYERQNAFCSWGHTELARRKTKEPLTKVRERGMGKDKEGMKRNKSAIERSRVKNCVCICTKNCCKRKKGREKEKERKRENKSWEVDYFVCVYESALDRSAWIYLESTKKQASYTCQAILAWRKEIKDHSYCSLLSSPLDTN